MSAIIGNYPQSGGRLVKILVAPVSALRRIPQGSMIDPCHERSIALDTPFGLCDGPRQSEVVAAAPLEVFFPAKGGNSGQRFNK
jgi:hypothetical protein